jgi:hypothetical protein
MELNFNHAADDTCDALGISENELLNCKECVKQSLGDAIDNSEYSNTISYEIEKLVKCAEDNGEIKTIIGLYGVIRECFHNHPPLYPAFREHLQEEYPARITQEG